MGQLVRFEKVKGNDLLMVREQIVSGILSTGADFAKRVLYLTDEIDWEAATKFIVALTKMDETDGLIRVVMMSSGGSEVAGWAIYDAIRSARNQVAIDAFGAVWSMAVAVLQAGDVRRMSRECRLMVHAGTVPMDGDLDQRTMIALGSELKRTNLRYQHVLAERTGMKFDQVVRYCDEEAYFSATEALRAGFVDQVIPYTDRTPTRAKTVKKTKKRKKRR